MKRAAIDTSTRMLCIALSDGARSYLTRLDVGTRLSAMLVDTLRMQLDALGWKAGDIGAFACGVGPGSFTALRIGMAAVKALAWAGGKPVAGIVSLDLLAHALRNEEATVIPVMDAKRSMVYTAAYATGAGKLRRIGAPRLIPTDTFSAEMERKICSRGTKRIIITGDGIPLVRGLLRGRMAAAVAADTDLWYPYPHALGDLAQAAWDRDQTVDAFRIEPVYLYPQECQVRK